MSKLDEVLRALNKMLGGSALQKASELVKPVEISLEKASRQGEKIPPKKPSVQTTSPKSSAGYRHTFFEEENGSVQQRYDPINIRKPQEPDYRSRYQYMRQIGTMYGANVSDLERMARRFLEQARYVATLTGQIHHIEPCQEHYPYFMNLSLRQFRSYVMLRSCFLERDYSQITEDTVGYLMLFLGELICGSAKPELPPEEILTRMEEIRQFLIQLPFSQQVTNEFYSSAVRSLQFDYALAHQLVAFLRQLVEQMPGHFGEPKFHQVLSAYYRKDETTLLETLSAMTPYHICTTAVCKKEPYHRIYPKLFTYVLQQLEEGIRSNKPMEERLFGRKYPRTHSAFYPMEAAVLDVPTFELEVYPWLSYRHDARTGKYEVLTHLQLNSDWIAGILRSMDFHFRIVVGATKLKNPGTVSISQDRMIEKAVQSFCQQHQLIDYETRKKEQQKKKKAAEKKLSRQPDDLPQPTRVEIDFSKLESIRQDAASVEARLLSVYESEKQTPPMQQEIKTSVVESILTIEEPVNLPQQTVAAVSPDVDSEWQAFYDALDDTKRNYLALLCKDATAAKQYLSALQKTTGMMPQMILEEINRIALEQIGDTVFETEGEVEFFEDYLEAAIRVFGK